MLPEPIPFSQRAPFECTYTHCLGWIKDGSLYISMVVFWILDLLSTVYVQHIGIATPQGLYLLKRHHLMGIGILNIKLRGSDNSLRFVARIYIPITRCHLSEKRPRLLTYRDPACLITIKPSVNKYMIVISHVRHRVTNFWQFDSLSKSLFREETQKTPKLLTSHRWIPLKKGQ